jgi:hypothetical protein
MPMLVMNGVRDSVLPFDGFYSHSHGYSFPPNEWAYRYFVEKYNCGFDNMV